MNNHRKIFSLIILAGTFVFSGCTVVGKSDGGVYKSSDGGKVFEQKVTIDQKNNIAKSNVIAIEIDPNNPDVVYIGTRNDGILKSVNGGESWLKDINGFASVSSIIVNPEDSQNIYITAAKTERGKILKTVNGGEKWEEIFTENANGPLVLSLAMDKNDANVLYAGDSLGGIYKTEDGGATWRSLFWARSAVRKIAIDSVNSNIVYFGTANTGALITKDQGTSFSSIIADGYIYNLQVHPTKENVLYLSNEEGLQKSEDAGTTWKVLNTLVKPENLGSRGLAIDPQDENVILYASANAFYKTTNGGESWMPVQFNISRGIDVIKINPTNSDIIYLGVNERSSGFTLLPQ